MRLLHTQKLEFEEFFDSQTPQYAILSHRWTNNEVSFQHFHRCKRRRDPKLAKIKNYCALALKEGYEWVWIDTCCIDKRSSAELTEAINSMYAWYQKAQVCHAYLADVRMSEDKLGDWEEARQKFVHSEWFTRGWTLQELLAPQSVIFLDRLWNVIGYKGYSSTGRVLDAEISLATSISQDDLLFGPECHCIAKRLSWISKRTTTRVEDIAYCMLGLCGVNMPLLYGEGEKAFIRLQLEIIKNIDDESIFAWFCNDQGQLVTYLSGMIAPSPRCFAKSGHVTKCATSEGKRPYSMTNKGLAYSIPWPKGWRGKQPPPGASYSLLLDCDIITPTLHFNDALVGDYPSITVDLVLLESGWCRLQGAKANIVLSSPVLWRDTVNKEGSFFNTIYVPSTDCFDYGDREDKLLETYDLPKGELYEEKGISYEYRDRGSSIDH
ncbi:MAG: hypothetical protein L6R41_005805 [Letrouitia leprolyta]|nr:MAG: hypothetical protein L6R41_005805 [Letrouitia leprolyta]